MNNLKELENVFIEVLRLDGDKDARALKFGSDGWDSLAHMALIAAIETKFNIMMSTDDIINLSSFNAAKEMLKRYDIVI